MKKFRLMSTILGGALLSVLMACSDSGVTPAEPAKNSPPTSDKVTFSDEKIQDIVSRSYQYVAMYNVNNKFALKNGWNRCVADTTLSDHTMQDIARPNNDTLYIACLLDLRKDPIIIDFPALDSKYVSLMVTGYDHYVTVPLSVTKGDFSKPEKVLFYSARTENFDGKSVEGVDRSFETTGDFVSAVFRVMPHAADLERFTKIRGQMQQVKATSLSEFLGSEAKSIDDVAFPSFGATDLDIYKNNFPEVLQFVVNHSTFDSGDELDSAFLASIKPMGIEPGKTYSADSIQGYEPDKFAAIADTVRTTAFGETQDPAFNAKNSLNLFRTKGNITLELLLIQSVIGPIGLPATEAVYPPIVTESGEPMNALNDYVLSMSKEALPPAKSFWSITLYDSANGFFIPNDNKKYSVGENGGMQLNAAGGIDIYIAAEKPEGVPKENWLPISRKDEALDIILRLYVPDVEKFKNYQVPKVSQIPAK